MMRPLSLLLILATVTGCVCGKITLHSTIGGKRRYNFNDAYVDNVMNWTIGANKTTMRWELSLLQYEFNGNLEAWCDAAIGEGWSHAFYTSPGEFKFFPLYSSRIPFQVRAWFEVTIVLTTVPRLSPPFIEILMGATRESYHQKKENYLNYPDTVFINQYIVGWLHYEGEEPKQIIIPNFQFWVFFYGLDRKKFITHELFWRNDYVGLNYTTNVTYGEFEKYEYVDAIVTDAQLDEDIIYHSMVNFTIDPPIPFAYFGVGPTNDPDADWKFQDMYHVKGFFEDTPLQMACDYYIKIMSYCSYPGMENYEVDKMFWSRCWPGMVYQEDSKGRIVSDIVLIFFAWLLTMVSQLFLLG